MLDQPEEKLLNKDIKQRFQTIMDSVMYLGQVIRYGIGYAVSQLVRTMSKLCNTNMAATKHLLKYLSLTTNAINDKQGGFKLTAFSDTNWNNNPTTEN